MRPFNKIVIKSADRGQKEYMKYLLFVVILMSAAVLVSAQTTSVTNSDLEKYRAEREKSDREYRENFAKKGFPSPEELDRRRRENDAQNQEFVRRLNEQMRAAENAAAQRRTNYVYYTYIPSQARQPVTDYPFIMSYDRGLTYPVQKTVGQQGYFAGGQFWPTPVRTPPPAPVRMPTKPPVRTHPK